MYNPETCSIMKKILSALTSLILISGVAHAQGGFSLTGGTTAPSASSVRPFGLNIVDHVKIGGSDSASASFKSNELITLKNFANTNLREGTPMSNSDVQLHRIDPSKIKLNTAADVRAYFVGEGAGYHNTLGFNSQGGSTSTFGSDPKLIFPDASERSGTTRTTSEPLKSGDFVNMGNFSANTQLNFFLIANGASGGTTTYSTNHINPDNLIHAVAFTLPGTPYLLIGFEDLYGGGDRDYNDILFTLDVGRANIDHLSSPEPTTGLILLGFIGLALARQRRKVAA